MSRALIVVRYHHRHHCLLSPSSTSWWYNTNNNNSMSQQRRTIISSSTITIRQQKQQQLGATPLRYDYYEQQQQQQQQLFTRRCYSSVNDNASNNNNNNNIINNNNNKKDEDDTKKSSSIVITMISPSYQCSQEMIYHIQNLIHNINNNNTTTATTNTATTTTMNDYMNIKILPKSIINIGIFQWDSIGIEFISNHNNDNNNNNNNNTNNTTTILHWLSLHTQTSTTTSTATTTTTTTNNKKVQRQLPNMELLSIHGNVSNLTSTYDMLSKSSKSSIDYNYYDTILLSLIQYRIVLKQLYYNTIQKIMLMLNNHDTIMTNNYYQQTPKYLKEYILRNYYKNNNDLKQTQLPYILLTNDDVNMNQVSQLHRSTSNTSTETKKWDYGILKEIVIPVLDTSHYEQLVSSLHKASSSLFHRPIPGIYQTITTSGNNNNHNITSNENNKNKINNNSNNNNNNNSGGLCIRPIPMAYEDRSISPITFIFHIPTVSSSSSSLFNGNDGNDSTHIEKIHNKIVISTTTTTDTNNNDDQNNKTNSYNYQRIGFTGGGIKNNHNGIGQYLIRNNNNNIYFGGYDIRLCSNPNISSIFHEAQQSLLASSINELQSTHVLGGEVLNNNNNIEMKQNNNSNGGGGKISVHKAISTTRTPTKNLNADTDKQEEQKQQDGGDCWQEFRVTMKHNPFQYLPRLQSSSPSTSTGNYSLSEYSIGTKKEQ